MSALVTGVMDKDNFASNELPDGCPDTLPMEEFNWYGRRTTFTSLPNAQEPMAGNDWPDTLIDRTLALPGPENLLENSICSRLALPGRLTNVCEVLDVTPSQAASAASDDVIPFLSDVGTQTEKRKRSSSQWPASFGTKLQHYAVIDLDKEDKFNSINHK